MDLPGLVRAVGGGGLRVNGWVGGGGGPQWAARTRMVCDLSEGPAALEARFDARDHKFCKNLRRAQRAFERDHGPARFVWNDRDPAVLDWVIARKREQYRRTRRHDVFACGWTGDLLRRLFEAATPDFGLRLVSLRTESGDLVAGEISMVGDGVLHLWFPAYADAYRRYGPGTLLTRLELEAAAAAGLRFADFGCGEESYKSTFAEPFGEVLEGALAGPLSTGAAFLGGDPLAGLSERRRAERAAYLPQDRRIAWNLPAVDLAALGAPHDPPDQARQKARAALEAVGAGKLAERGVADMSGGERARTLFARFLVTGAPALLADEPAAGLDPDAQLLIMDLLKARAAAGAAVLVSLHDLPLAARYADRVVVLSGGQVAADGAPGEALAGPVLRRVFGLDARWVDTPDGPLLSARRG